MNKTVIYIIIAVTVITVVVLIFNSSKQVVSTTPLVQSPAPVETSSPVQSPSLQEQNMVTLTADGFSPETLTIKTGDTVTWVNKSGSDATVNSAPHPVHSDYPPLNLGTFPDGGTLSLTFPTAGTYKYHNHLNPSQTGIIIVQ